MFIRVETGFKADFQDPEAMVIHRRIREIHSSLAERIRWIRRLKVAWLELDGTRDKIIQATQAAFKNQVTDWVFTGDLLPSAAGVSGTLYDLMQESPFRPGVFHGIEKRKRLQVHDEDALVITDIMQTLLGRRSPQDRVVTGELLVVEGAKLTQSDLEWIARNCFAQDADESWSLLSEDELKRNSRFQSEQVAKYLSNQQAGARSRLLQFRTATRGGEPELVWSQVESTLKKRVPNHSFYNEDSSAEDWNFNAQISFSSSALQTNTQAESEFQLIQNQLNHYLLGNSTRLQSVLAVLPEKNRLWRGELEGSHPIRIREDFEKALERVAETTDTPVALMKLYEEAHEAEPAYFWTSNISVGGVDANASESQSRVADLVFVGHYEQPATRDLTFVETLKAVYTQGKKGKAIEFAFQCSGRSLLECLKSSKQVQYGFDLVLDGIEDWFKKYFESPLPLGLIWGVSSEQREWLFNELRTRGVPFLHFGSTSLTGDVRILQAGEQRAKVNISEFFISAPRASELVEENLLSEPMFTAEIRKQPKRFKNRYSTEELVLKPEAYHVSTPSPLVIRPELSTWSGLMTLSDLCGQEFKESYLDYLLRKCTAMGGQIHSIQCSYLNGLKAWSNILNLVQKNYGIPISEGEAIGNPDIHAHWLAIQLISKVADVRSVRTEEFKFANDRIYWLPGDFEHPATRWLAGFEGRYQGGLHSAVAIESTDEGQNGVIDTLTYALMKRRLGAEVRIQHHFPGGFFVSVSENERFAVEEEWRVVGVSFEFVGRVTASPYLVIRNEEDQVQTISIEDIA